MIRGKIKGLFLILAVMTALTGCAIQYNETSPQELRGKILAADNDSTVSWFYVGTKEGHVFLIEKLQNMALGHKVKEQRVKLEGITDMDYSGHYKDWVSIKSNNIVIN